MKKRVVSLLLALCLVIGLFPLSASAEEPTQVGTGAFGENNALTWTITEVMDENQMSVQTLTITGTGAIPDFNTDPDASAPWDAYRYNIRHIVVEDGVTAIGANAFCNMGNVSSVTLPSAGLTTVGDSAFQYCGPFIVDENNTFTMTLPSTLTSIGDSAFSSCPVSGTVDLSNVTSLGTMAFNSSAITGVTLSESLTAIPDSAFSGTQLTSVDLSHVTELGQGAFSGTQLTTVAIPAGLADINNAFSNCPKLTGFTVDSGNTAYSAVDGVLFSKDGTQLLSYPQGKTETSYELPAGVTSIASDSGLSSAQSLTTLTVADGNTAYSAEGGVLYNKEGTGIVLFPCAWNETAFNIPAATTNISAALSKSSIQTYTVAEGNTVYAADNGVLYKKDGSSLKLYAIPQRWQPKALTLPATATGFEKETAFAYGGGSIASISFPAGFDFTPGWNTKEDWSSNKQISILPTSIASFTVAAEHETAKSEEGVIVSKDGKTLIALPSQLIQDMENKIAIPEGFTKVQTGAIKAVDNYNLTVWIPDSVELTGEGAFDWTTLGDYSRPVSLMGGDKVQQYVEQLSEEGRRYVEYVPLPDMQNLNWYNAKNELERFLNDTAGLPEGQTKRTFPYGTVNGEIFEAYRSWYQSQQSSGGDSGMGSEPSSELPESMTGTTHMMVEGENGSIVELELRGFFMLADPNGMLPVGDNKAPLMFVIDEVTKQQEPSENPGGDPSDPGMGEPDPIVDKYREIYQGMCFDFTPAYDNDESGLVPITITAPEVRPQITVESTTFTYTGSAIEPQLEVEGEPTDPELGGTYVILTEGVDYTATYTNNVNAGQATVTIAAKEGGNCTFAADADLTATFEIAPKELTITIKPQTINYGEPISSTVNDVTVAGLADGEELTSITLTGPTTVPGGNITSSNAVIKRGEVETTRNYEINEIAGKLTINQVPAAVATAPTAQTLTYTGAAQALVSAGTATGGTMQYSTDGETYSNAIPEGTNAGTYTVYYKVVGDNNHSDSAADSVEVTIGKAVAAVTTAPANANPTYNGAAQALVSAGTTSDGVMQYSLEENGPFSADLPTGTNAGSYTVYYKVAGDDNHNDNTVASVSATIAQTTGTATASVYVKYSDTAAKTAFLAGSIEALKLENDTASFSNAQVTASSEKLNGTPTVDADGTLHYQVASSGVNAGDTATVTVDVAGLTNYSTVTVTVTINLTDKTPVTVELSGITGLDKVYDGTAITISSGAAGTYDGGTYNGNWTYDWFAEDGTTSATPLNAGKYVLKVSVDDANYVGEATKVVTISKKPVTITASDQTITYGDSFNTADATKVSAALASGDSISTITLTPSTANAGTGTITPSGAAIENGSNMNMTANYEITYAAGTLTVEKADPTVTAPTAKTLTYDGTAQALVNAGTATGGVMQYSLEENGTFSTDVPTGTDAGSYTVYYKVEGDNNHNDVAATAVPVAIGKLAVTITPNAQTKTYGAEDPELTYTASTVSPAPTITGALGRAAGEYAGEYAITLGTLTAGNNYDLTLSGTVKLTVTAAENPAQIAGTATVMKERTVDLSGNVTGVPEGTGTVTYAVTSGDGTMNGSEYTAPATTGTATVTVTVPALDVNGDGQAEYNAKTGTITITISDKSDAAVSFGTVPESKTYGDSTFTITATAQNPGANGVWTWTSSNDSALSVSGSGNTATVTVAGAGSATITANYESNDTIGNLTTASITVNKAAATITADSKRVTIGGTVPAVDTLTYRVTGLKNNDTLTTPPTLAYYDSEGNPVNAADIDTSAAASYIIKANGAVPANAGNYEVSYADGTLTIAAKPVTPPSSGDDEPIEPTPDDEPVVETNTAPDGTVTTTTTWPDGQQAVDVKAPDGGKEITVTASDGGKMAEISIAANPGESKKFEDVKAGAWYEKAVDAATGYSLFNGTSETKFSPNAPMTRGMLATVLHNLSGNPEYGTGADVFDDVKDGIWYEDPVDWAYKIGVAAGTSATEFSPDQSITREQLVAMLYRYAEKIGAGSKNRTGLTSFPDSGKVAGYAKDAMQWAVAEGFISGRANGGRNYIAPQGTATRAEVATVLARFVEYLKK